MTILGPIGRWLSGPTGADSVPEGPVGRGRRVGGLAAGLVMMTAMLPAPSVAAAEIGHWLGAAPIPVPREDAVAVALPNGRVLVTSGNPGRRGSEPTADSSIYDPVSNTWSAAAPIPVPRIAAVAAPLPGGKVLVTGGNGSPPSAAGVFGDSQIYDPASDTWSPAAPMPLGREYAMAAPLPGGKVLVTGGSSGYDNRTADSQIYDPVSNTWSVGAPMPIERIMAVAAPLPGGRVLVTNGLVDGRSSTDSRIYDAATDSWTPAAPHPTARFSAGVAVLADGKVFVTAGHNNSGYPPTNSHVYDPASDSWAEVARATPRMYGVAAPLPGGRVLVAGGSGLDGFVAASAVYVPTAAAPLASIATPADGVDFVAGAVPHAEFSCSAGAGGTLEPGTAGCSASIDGGSPVASGTALAGNVGEHAVVVTATQTDGQQTSVTHRYTVAVMAPTVSITSPADGAYFAAGAAPDAEFSCAAGAGATLEPGTAGCSASIDGGSPVAGGTPLAGSVGEHTIVVTATQTDGQQTSVTRGYRVVVGAPEVSMTTPPDGASYIAGSAPDMEFSCTAGAGGALVPGTNGCHAVIDLQHPLLASGAPLADTVGTHTIMAIAVGADGQRTSVTHHYTVTAGAPSVLILTPPDGATYVHGSVPVPWAGCGAGLGGMLKPGVEGCSVSIDGGPPVWIDTLLADTVGSHTITATATGTDGQQTSVTHHYAVTATPPTVSVTTPADGASYVYGAVPAAEFTCAAGVGASLEPAPDGCSASVDGGPVLPAGSPLPGTAGEHTVVVTATGSDGQQATATRSYSVVAQPPTVSVTTPADGATYDYGAVPDVEFACTAGAGGVLMAGFRGCAGFLDGGAAVTSGDALAGTVGEHTVVVTATGIDWQQASTTRRYTVVAQPPAVSVTTPAAGAEYVFGAVPDMTFACTAGAGGALEPEPAGCSASVDGGAAVTSGDALAGTVGEHTVVVTATGVDGQRASTTRHYTVVKADQTIGFTSAAPTTAQYGGAPYEVTAAATSGLPVGLSIDPSVSSACAMDGTTVTFIAAGTCTINADQAGDDNYNRAPQVAQTFQVEKAATTLTSGTGVKHLLLPGVTLKASLTRTDSAAPIAGQPITFTIGRDAACHARTGPDGVATCTASVGLLTLLLVDSYTATYDGTANYRPGVGTGAFGPVRLTGAPA